MAQGQEAIANDLTKVYALLLATKLEVRLNKLLYEAPAFDAHVRSVILGEGSQDKQRLRAIDEAFKRRYEVRNLLWLKHQERLVDRIAEAVSDLAVSRKTFERDFDSHFQAVEDARARLQESGYAEWVQRQRRSFKLGRKTPRSRSGEASETPHARAVRRDRW